jgi:hypothetical protein
MHALDARQMELLEVSARAQFAQRLIELLRSGYPAYAGVPAACFEGLVETGLRRGRHYGFELQRTLAEFVEIMVAVSPTFDLDPQAHAVLVEPGIPVDRRMEEVIRRLPYRAWSGIAARGSQLGWYLSEDLYDATPLARISTALEAVFAGRQDGVGGTLAGPDRIQAALEAASTLGWRSENAGFVFAAASLVYGDGFHEELGRLPWVSGVFDRELRHEIQIVLLRMRLALDARLWI